MTTALIVDDSHLARTVLRRSLFENGIAVEETPSAEAAIAYLRLKRPDIIFLDHQMPGMDGFEALRAIKANPHTATIPVMMYTAQEGQVYLSQARALGAVDVLPKTLKPVDLTRILCKHHLTGDSRTSSNIEQAIRDVKEAAHGIAESARIIHEDEKAELIRNILQEYREILLDEVRAQISRMNKDAVTMTPRPTAISPAAEVAVFHKRLTQATIATTLAAAVGFAALFFNTARLLSEATRQPPGPTMSPEFAAVERDVAHRPAFHDEPESSDLSDVVAWTKTKFQPYAFGEIPLGDDRALEYGSVLANLQEHGFEGSVHIDVHEGRFCLNYTSEGSFELAPSAQPAIACDRIGTASETVIGTQQTVMFSNMLAVADRDGRLHIEAEFHGPTVPIIDYPILDHNVTAGDWNAAAASNQRVTLGLVQSAQGYALSSRTAAIAQLGPWEQFR
jgi:CheY-like chemotaxis protein